MFARVLVPCALVALLLSTLAQADNAGFLRGDVGECPLTANHVAQGYNPGSYYTDIEADSCASSSFLCESIDGPSYSPYDGSPCSKLCCYLTDNTYNNCFNFCEDVKGPGADVGSTAAVDEPTSGSSSPGTSAGGSTVTPFAETDGGNSSDDSGTSGGVIGGVVGTLLFVAIAAAVGVGLFCFVKRRRQRQQLQQPANSPPDAEVAFSDSAAPANGAQPLQAPGPRPAPPPGMPSMQDEAAAAPTPPVTVAAPLSLE